MSSRSSSSASGGHRVELLEQTIAEVNRLDLDVRREVAALIVELHRDPYRGDLMDDRPPRVLQGCRKIRFDHPDRAGKPRFRLVYRNEPEDGAVAALCVLAVAPRAEMVAYAHAASRLTARIAQEGGGS